MTYTSASLCMIVATLFATESLPYPKDFRSWTHVKSAIIQATHPAARTEGGLHHIYANPKAVEGYATGKFPDGSAIVYELLETEEKDGVVSEGARRRVDLMVKDAARYPTTGGWGFTRFSAAGQNDLPAQQAAAGTCFACHQRVRDHGYVFSRIR